MKKLMLTVALLGSVAVMQAKDANALRKESREYIRHSTHVDSLPISKEAKAAEKSHMARKGEELHGALAQGHPSHQERRMPMVKKHAERHAENPFKGYSSDVQTIITQD